MIGMVCVREDLFNGLGSEKSADQQISFGRWDGESPAGLSIAGMLQGMIQRHRQYTLIRFIRFVLFIWSVLFNQTNQIDQINKRDHPSHAPRLVARAARRKASNNRRWRGCRSKRNSGCHWIPRKKRWAGDSIASTIPSGARALTTNDGATALTD